MRARDFIKPGEDVLVIFTRGDHLEFHPDNAGSTGEWEIDPGRLRLVDRVVIYHRDDEMRTNTLYIANRAAVESANRQGRHNIQLAHVQYVGTTTKNWCEFAEGGPNPIRYLP